MYLYQFRTIIADRELCHQYLRPVWRLTVICTNSDIIKSTPRNIFIAISFGFQIFHSIWICHLRMSDNFVNSTGSSDTTWRCEYRSILGYWSTSVQVCLLPIIGHSHKPMAYILLIRRFETSFIEILFICFFKQIHLNLLSAKLHRSWWRHQMETFSALLVICAGNSPVTGEFPAQRPLTRSNDIFFELRLNKRLGKQHWGWWFEMPLRPLWRHCNEINKNQPLNNSTVLLVHVIVYNTSNRVHYTQTLF